MSNPFPTEPTDTPVVDVVKAKEAAEAAKAKRRKRNLGIGAGIAAGVTVLSAGGIFAFNTLRGPSNAGPTPVDTPTSESTPTPNATAEAFDATKLDIPADATDEQIESGFAATVNAEVTGDFDSNAIQELINEFKKPENFSLSVEDFADMKAKAIIDAIIKTQYVEGWAENNPDKYQNRIILLSANIQAYILTSETPSVYSNKFTITGDGSVKPGANSNQKIATVTVTDTNNAATVLGDRDTDHFLANYNGTSSTAVVTFTVVRGKLLISDLHN